MKKTILKLSLILAIASSFSTVFAQVSTYERLPGYWIFGLNGGFAYQQSDIPSTPEGFGLGLTLGKNLYYKPGAGLSFDLRGRGLYTKTYGLDYFQSTGINNNTALNGTNTVDYTKLGGGPGFVYQNNKTDHVELGLEGVVNFNKLREKTNVILSLYGGVGVDWYNTKTDQADANGIYSPQYESLDPTMSVSYKKSQLRNAILDGVYETNAEGFENGTGRLGIMPGVGFELGYQFTPKFSMGIGHKFTFTKTDLFDGQQWTDDNRLTSDNDIHHYTNLHMRWIIEQKEKEQKPPMIKVLKPEIDPFTTRNPNGFIKAEIKNINSAMDVKFTVNGYDEGFNFKNENFSSNFRLLPGRNDILITASNLAGTDQETVVIFYEEPIINTPPQGRRPSVNITNPSYDNFRTDIERFTVKATVREVYDKRDIFFTVDGREFRNFNFDSRTNILTATINLDEGQNDVRIEVRNNIGNAIDETTIILERAFQKLPVVDITKPFNDPHYTTKRSVVLEAKIYNVESKEDILLTVNGRSNYDFTYVDETLFANVDLYDYKTIVAIEGSNTVGNASDDIIIFLEEEDDEPEVPEIETPVVTITSMSQPTVDPFDPDNCKSTVIATILNVEDKNDIFFILNGRKYNDFSFNPTTGILKKTIRMEVGNNEVIIKAQNEAGSDEDRASKEGCKIEEENPPVVTITDPLKSSAKVSKPKTKVTATVLNIDSKNDIEFVVNGKRNSYFNFNANTKVFTATITLLEGNNTVVLIATNRDGKAEDNVNILYKKPEVILAIPPKVTINSPINNSNTIMKEVSLDAEILNITNKADIGLFLNGRRTSSFNFDQNNNRIAAQITLAKGKNTIRVSAENTDGADEKSIVIFYNPPGPILPEVKITSPSTSVSTTTRADINVLASIKNVRSKSNIILTINGRKYNGFTFKNNIVNANLKLKKGKNTIAILATNNDGNAEDQRVINFQPPTNPPSVKIMTPANNTATDQSTTIIKATIEHIIQQNDIKLIVNGQSKSFTFFKGVLSADVVLSSGKNTINVKASNVDGSDEETVNVTYTPPLAKPTVEFITPKKSGVHVEKNNTTIVAVVKNVTQKKDISIKVNGKFLKTFDFQPRTNKVTVTATLKDGVNVIFIEGRNTSGKASANTSVKFVKPIEQSINPPKVTITSVSDPTIDPFNPHKAKSTIIANLSNISAKEEITFTINGRATNDFSFNTKTQTFQTTINLTKGKTRVKISVENAAGSDEASRTITF